LCDLRIRDLRLHATSARVAADLHLDRAARGSHDSVVLSHHVLLFAVSPGTGLLVDAPSLVSVS
jgi:hypothetical protein